jgi:hypothetical protein
MKQTRLLEIIREEINEALNVLVTNKKGETTTMPYNTPEDKKSVMNLKQDNNITNIETTAGQNIKEDNLEEDTLNEMAYDIIISQPNELAKLQDKIKDSTKKGEQKLAKALEIIQKTKKEGKPIRQRDIANEMGLIQQEINPLINKLIDVGILEKGESVTGVTKKKVTDKAQGRPASEKPKAEPKAKAEKVATRTTRDDGMDDVSYSDVDSEDKEATQNIGSDSTAKELGATASVADKFANLFNAKTTEEAKKKMQELAKRANSGDQKAKAFFDNKKNSKIIQAYRNAQKVNA